MSTAQFRCEISNTNPAIPLVLTIRINNVPIQTLSPVPAKYQFEHDFEDTADPQQHQIEFELSGKLLEHTKIDAHGNIISDAVVIIKNKEFESVMVDMPFDQHTQYRHNFNNNGQEIVDEFFGIMGCNGTACFKFTTPIYVWLLENL